MARANIYIRKRNEEAWSKLTLGQKSDLVNRAVESSIIPMVQKPITGMKPEPIEGMKKAPLADNDQTNNPVPRVVKGTGFYTPMDLVPTEAPSEAIRHNVHEKPCIEHGLYNCGFKHKGKR